MSAEPIDADAVRALSAAAPVAALPPASSSAPAQQPQAAGHVEYSAGAQPAPAQHPAGGATAPHSAPVAAPAAQHPPAAPAAAPAPQQRVVDEAGDVSVDTAHPGATGDDGGVPW